LEQNYFKNAYQKLQVFFWCIKNSLKNKHQHAEIFFPNGNDQPQRKDLGQENQKQMKSKPILLVIVIKNKMLLLGAENPMKQKDGT